MAIYRIDSLCGFQTQAFEQPAHTWIDDFKFYEENGLYLRQDIHITGCASLVLVTFVVGNKRETGEAIKQVRLQGPQINEANLVSCHGIMDVHKTRIFWE